MEKAITILAEGKSLPPENKDHALSGNYSGCRECHIAPGWHEIALQDYFFISPGRECIAIYFDRSKRLEQQA